MTQARKNKKRPCRICRKWFSPDPRVGERQMTCGGKDCQIKWHARKCAEWNKKNSAYFREIYLSKKLAAVSSLASPSPGSNSLPSDIIVPQTSRFRKLPINLIQEVIGVQPLVIIEYMTQVLLNSFQEVILPQVVEIMSKPSQGPHRIISRADSPGRGP